MSFDRGAPAFWFIEITLDGETLRHCNAFEPITFDGAVYEALGDRFTAPADIDRAANLKSQKFKLTYDSSRQTDNTDPIGKILDSNWKRRPIRVRYAIGDMDAAGFDFSAPTIIADETGRIKDLEDTLAAGDAPALEMEIESGALIFLERRNQTRSPLNQRAAFPGDAFFDLAKRLDGVVLPWRTKRARQGSAQITYDIDGVASRQMIIGRGITKGSFVFGCTIDVHRSRWCQVYALADHQCEALEKLFINGQDVLAGEAPLVHGVQRTISAAAFNSGGPRLYVTWYDGRHDQTANARLISGTASQALKWTSAHRGRGVSYVMIEHAWDSDLPESFSYEFVVKGAKIYQERLDTTAGGSGAHRLDNPDTWTWTENPEEALRHYLRGRVVAPSSSYKWFGVGASSAFLDPYALYAYRAAHCEASVATQGGGTQARYTANGWISASDSHAKNIQKLADCMVADPVDEGGRVSIRLAEPQTPVVELFDSDLIEDEETVIIPNARGDDVVNRIEGQYLNPSNKYAAEDFAAIENAAFELVDGEQITGSWKQELETSEERAQRKATLYLNKMRRTLEMEETFGLKAKDVRPGDWITRSSALRGFPAGKLFIADEVRRYVDGTVRLILLEVNPSELVWDENAAVIAPAQDPFVLEFEPVLVPTIAVSAISISGGGVEIPAVRFAVTTYDVAQGDEVICEYGIWNGLSGASAAIVGASDYVKIPGNFQTFDALKGLLPGTGYAFRFRARDGERFSDWTSLVTLTSTGTYQAGRSAIADSIVGQGWGATAAESAASNTWANFAARKGFNFSATLEGVTSSASSTLTWVAGVAQWVTAATDQNVFTTLNLAGRSIPKIRMRIRPTSASFSWEGVVYYDTSGHSYSASFNKAIGSPTGLAQNVWVIAEFDMTSLSVGGTDWIDSTIISVRFDITNGTGETWEIDWIAFGDFGADPVGIRGIDDDADQTATNTAASIFGQGWGATASAADASNALVPLGANGFINTNFTAPGTFPPAGWGAGSDHAVTGLVRSVVTSSQGKRVVSAGTGSAPASGLFFDVIRPAGYAETNADIIRRTTLPVVPGQRVCARALLGNSAAASGIQMFLVFRKVDGSFVASVAGDLINNTASDLGGGKVGELLETSIFATAPTGAATAGAIFRVYCNGGTFPFGWVAEPMISVVPTAQTAVPLYVPGPPDRLADQTATNTAASVFGQGSQAIANHYRGTTYPGTPTEGSWWADTAVNVLKLYTGGAWQNVATLSTAAQTRGKIISGALSFSANSTWQEMASVDVSDVPSGGVIQVPYVDVEGQFLTGLPGRGYEWRLTEAPTSSPSTKTVIKSGTFTVSSDNPPLITDLVQPSAALVTVTNTGSVRYKIELQKTSGTGTVGLLATANFIINPS